MPINATKKPIYESFSMIHLDGTFMCHINGKRANWYVEKGLAEWIDEKTFQLKFEPKGKGKKDLLFYNQKLENRCVVCGNDHQDELNKHHVVPSVFRSRFPIQYKESNHHDVLVTCLDCHENYEHEAMLYKIELVKENDSIFIRYQDNGVGIQENNAEKPAQLGNGIGFLLLQDTSDKNGFIWKNKEEGGFFVQLKLKMQLNKNKID